MDRELAEHFSPFGEADCESELKLLQGEYSNYFFYHTWFNEAALAHKAFLIVGRRGAGKTALSQFFSFQRQIPNAIAIDVDEPVAFEQVLQDIASTATQSREVAIPRIAKIWNFVIWSIIFRELKNKDARIRAACIFGDKSGKIASFIRHALKSLLNRLLKTENDLWEELEDILADDRIRAGQEAVMELARKKPVILSIDTLENYAVNDVAMMRAIAALIQFGSDFNRNYAMRGLHLKLFLMDEVFPYLKEEMVLNSLKFIRNVVYLHWRPKDLMRLISWRFYNYLQAMGKLDPASKVIDWDNHKDVLEKLWYPYFGTSLRNQQDLPEPTFPYLLRHTQMRPRQLIMLSNAIANRALAEQSFPYFRPKDIVRAIYQTQNDLAEEVFNSYSSVYPKVGRIMEALSGLPMIFKGSELDKRAPLTASEWPIGEYSPFSFRQLVAELGVVGRVRHFDEQTGYVEADFEYSMEGRLTLMVTDLCVIHPMFYRKLNINLNRQLRVYPFPDHDEYRELDYKFLHSAS